GLFYIIYVCLCMCFFFFFFFFFQAEDGIRDLTVTGVQTCALPISCAACRRPAAAIAGNGPARVQANARAAHGPSRCSTRAGASQIGRASCRERVESSGGGGALKKKTKDKKTVRSE